MRYIRTISPKIQRTSDGDKTLRNRWKHMLERCSNTKRKDYKYYGAKGVVVCAEWHRFINFYAWFDDALRIYCLFNKKTAGVSALVVDRIDPNKGYSPDNCRLITVAENAKRAIYGRDAKGRFSIVNNKTKKGIKRK